MLKKLFFLCGLFAVVGNTFANNNVTLEINGVIFQGGMVYVAVYSNENDYKTETSSIKFILDPASATITRNLELPDGEYVVSVFQDVNNNEQLDYGLFGIPKEPVGITKYSGKGIPGGFKKLKVPVNSNATKITVNIGNVKEE